MIITAIILGWKLQNSHSRESPAEHTRQIQVQSLPQIFQLSHLPVLHQTRQKKQNKYIAHEHLAVGFKWWLLVLIMKTMYLSGL